MMQKGKRRAIANDRNGMAIYKDSLVMYRGKECKVTWDKQMLCFYLVPEDWNTVKGIPFTTYIARECEVI